MGKLTLWRATSAIPNERRIYMIFLPPALGFALPRKQPTKNVATSPTISRGQNFQKIWKVIEYFINHSKMAIREDLI